MHHLLGSSRQHSVTAGGRKRASELWGALLLASVIGEVMKPGQMTFTWIP